MQTLLVILGSLLPLVSGATYVWDIMAGKVLPQFTTRFLLMIITLLSFISLLAGHDHSGVWLALTSCAQSMLLWGLSIWHGTGSAFDRLDRACFVLCGGGVLLWLTSGQSVIGLIASILADFVACIPSLHKTWRRPGTETIPFYALDAAAGLCILLGAASLSWMNALFPGYIFLINAAFVAIIVTRRRQT